MIYSCLPQSFRFTAGKASSVNNGPVHISVQQDWTKLLLTVFAGFPAPSEVKGIGFQLFSDDEIIGVGQTNHNGCAFLKDLEKGKDYTVVFNK